jgi:hypothetical protein
MRRNCGSVRTRLPIAARGLTVGALHSFRRSP